ncbi:hypothetical protein [Clostridium sp.]|uniref:hypothetical protein n=1 Tax=Clostridium sp. TaxID=1506 RepID=UPI0026017CB7|nr:hypothetical protein [uncultured Clostridium sp.]
MNSIFWILGVILVITIILISRYSLQLIHSRKEIKTEKNNQLSEVVLDLSYELPPPIDTKLSVIDSKYKIIVNGDINKDLAKNRFEYIIIVLKESSKNKLFNNMSEEYFNNIIDMMDSVDTLFDEIIRGIKEIDNITNKTLEDYMKDKVKEFTNVTKSMEDDFKKINKKEI